MPPLRDSRYLPAGVMQTDYDELVLPIREPFRFEARSDNCLHQVVTGDTLETLAELFLSNAQRSWIIADFQPESILDTTEELAVGTYLIIPSIEYVNAKILGSVEGAAAEL